jgi:3-oxoacyl-[acyl-carrier-protein] synthase II
MHRVVVTGFGVITPFGYGIESCKEAIFSGNHNFREVKRFNTENSFAKLGAEAPQEVQPTYRNFGKYCVDEALDMAGLKKEKDCDVLERTWVAVGNLGDGMILQDFYQQYYGSSEESESVKVTYQVRDEPVTIHDRNPVQHAEHVAEYIGSSAPRVAFTNACIASSNAIAYGCNQIRKGRCQTVLAGGLNVLHPLVYYNFDSSRAMAEDVVRPFSSKRSGLLIGDGAGMLVLESLEHARARGAEPLVEIIGCGISSDGFHVTQPHPSGNGLVRAMRSALKQAGCKPADIDYINAHGTGTPLNDKSETKGVLQVFGDYADQVPISSTKSMTGHMLEATGVVEMIISIMSLMEQRIPPTANLLNRDPELPLDYVFEGARNAKLKRIMTNSAAFGGNNCSIILQSL